MSLEEIANLGREQANDYDNPKPLFTPEDASIAAFVDEPPPNRSYLLGDLLPLGISGAIVGPGGVSKSFAAIDIAIAVATQKAALGTWEVQTTGQVLCLFAEEEKQELHRRMYFALKNHDGATRKRAKKNLFIRSVVGQNNLLTEKKSSNGDAEQTHYLSQLIATVAQFKDLKLIIIDPASRFRGGDENTAQDATRFVEAIESLAQQTGATVLVIHHTNKSGLKDETNQNIARGSSAFVDGLRWVMGLQTMTPSQAEKLGIDKRASANYVAAKMLKNNYGPPLGEETWLERGQYGILQPARLNSRSIAAESKILDKLRDVPPGHPYTLTSFINTHCGKNKELGLGKDRLKSRIKDMVARNLLVLRASTREERQVNPNAREVLDLPLSQGGNRVRVGRPRSRITENSIT